MSFLFRDLLKQVHGLFKIQMLLNELVKNMEPWISDTRRRYANTTYSALFIFALSYFGTLITFGSMWTSPEFITVRD